MEYLIENGIDAYIADNKFRHRDPRFAEADRHKERFNKEGRQTVRPEDHLQPRDFTVKSGQELLHLPGRQADV